MAKKLSKKECKDLKHVMKQNKTITNRDKKLATLLNKAVKLGKMNDARLSRKYKAQCK